MDQLKNIYKELKQQYEVLLNNSNIQDNIGFFFLGYLSAKKDTDLEKLLQLTEQIQTQIKQEEEIKNQKNSNGQQQKVSLNQMFNKLENNQNKNQQIQDSDLEESDQESDFFKYRQKKLQQQKQLTKPSPNKNKKFIRISQNPSRSRSRSRSRSISPENQRNQLKFKGKNELTVDIFQQIDQLNNSNSNSRRPSPSPEIGSSMNIKQKALERKRLMKEQLQKFDQETQKNQQRLLKNIISSNNLQQENNDSQQTEQMSEDEEENKNKQNQQKQLQKPIKNNNQMQAIQMESESEEEQEQQIQKQQQQQQQIIKKEKNVKKQNSLDDALKMIQEFEEQEKLNQEQIKLLQQQDEQEIKKIQKQKEEQQAEDNICNICYGDLMEEQPIPLQNCEHIFHQSCLLDYIKTEIDTRKVQFKCPQDDCEKMTVESDFKDILDKKYFDKYLGYSIATYVDENSEQAAWCPTAGCDFVFLLDEKDKDKNNFECEQCKKHYCLNCRVEYNKGHKGMTCKEFQISNKRDKNDIEFEKFVKKKKFKQCPHCSFWVSKTEGCYNMTCKCGHTFCYVCGGPTVNYYCAICSGKKQQQKAVKAPARKVVNKRKQKRW